MIIEEAIAAYLVANSGVNALLGNRIYPNNIPQDCKLPAAAYQVITTTDDDTHDGPSGWTEINLQITVDADTYGQAKLASRAINAALNGTSGTLSGIPVHYISRQNAYDGYGEGSQVTTIRQDYSVKYSEN